MRRVVLPTRKEVVGCSQPGFTDPRCNDLARAFRDLELDRPMRLLLHHDRSRGYPIAVTDIVDPKLRQVTPSKLAVDCQVEDGQLADPLGELEPHPDGPYIFQPQRRLLADQLPLVPRS